MFTPNLNSTSYLIWPAFQGHSQGWAWPGIFPTITVSCPTITNFCPIITSSLDSHEDSQQHTKQPYFNTVKRKRVPRLLNHDFEEGIEIDGVSRDPLHDKSLGKSL